MNKTMRNMFQLILKQMVYKTDVKVYTLEFPFLCSVQPLLHISIFASRAFSNSTIVHFELNWGFFWNVEVCRLVGSPFGVIWITLLETSICPLHHDVFETIKSSFFDIKNVTGSHFTLLKIEFKKCHISIIGPDHLLSLLNWVKS